MTEPVVIQLTRAAVTVAEPLVLVAARTRFQADRRLRLPRFLDDELLALIRRHLAEAPFHVRIAASVSPPAVDMKLADAALHGALRLLMGDAQLCSAVEAVTGLGQLQSFAGAVYRMEPGHGHRDSWHDDVTGSRRVGITVNLSENAFEGGELQMREKLSERLLWRFANTGPGDALLFAIDASLEHCIAPMTGTTAKTALAGWFCADDAGAVRGRQRAPASCRGELR